MLFCFCPYGNLELEVTIISNIASTGPLFQPETKFQWLALSKSHSKNCCCFHVFKTNSSWMSFSFSYVTVQLQQFFICNFIFCLCSSRFLCSRIQLQESEKALFPRAKGVRKRDTERHRTAKSMCTVLHRKSWYFSLLILCPL